MKIEKMNANIVGATSSRPRYEGISQDKGITLVSLIITIIILLILSGAAITSIKGSNDVAPYNNMVADLTLLEDKILIYYNRYEEIPKTSRTINIDGVIYYEIDLSKLDGITLNYGKEYGETVALSNSSDVYAVDENLNVYYLKGVEKSGEIYHTK